MSMDKSLVSRGKLKRQRNVLSRAERINILEEEEKWNEEEDSVFGLPKVRVFAMKKRSKKKAEEKPEEAAAEAEGAKATPETTEKEGATEAS